MEVVRPQGRPVRGGDRLDARGGDPRANVGETFEAVVVDVDRDGAAGTVQLRDPAVTARCEGRNLALGESVTVRLELADVLRRQVRFALD